MSLSRTKMGACIGALLGFLSCGLPPEIGQLQKTITELQAQREKDREAVQQLDLDLRRGGDRLGHALPTLWRRCQ